MGVITQAVEQVGQSTTFPSPPALHPWPAGGASSPRPFHLSAHAHVARRLDGHLPTPPKPKPAPSTPPAPRTDALHDRLQVSVAIQHRRHRPSSQGRQVGHPCVDEASIPSKDHGFELPLCTARVQAVADGPASWRRARLQEAACVREFVGARQKVFHFGLWVAVLCLLWVLGLGALSLSTHSLQTLYSATCQSIGEIFVDGCGTASQVA